MQYILHKDIYVIFHKRMKLSFTILMETEDIILSEIKRRQKDKYYIFSSICGSKKVGLIEGESRVVVTKTREVQSEKRWRKNG